MADHPRYRLTRGAFDIISAFGSLRAAALPGPVITAVLGLQGHQPSAVRNQVTRLVQRGMLRRTKAGTTSVYSLDEAMQHRFDMLSADAAAPPFTGRFEGLVFAVPETQRSLRDRILYVARFAGYRPLRPGVLIGFADATDTLVAALATELEEAGGPRASAAGDGLLWERCALVPADLAQARRWTDIAFDVRGLHMQLSEIEEIARRAPELVVDQASYFDAFFDVSQRVMGFPSLPVELTPGLRGNERIGAAMGALIGLFVERFAAEVVETALAQPSAALIEFLPDAVWAPR